MAAARSFGTPVPPNAAFPFNGAAMMRCQDIGGGVRVSVAAYLSRCALVVPGEHGGFEKASSAGARASDAATVTQFLKAAREVGDALFFPVSKNRR